MDHNYLCDKYRTKKYKYTYYIYRFPSSNHDSTGSYYCHSFELTTEVVGYKIIKGTHKVKMDGARQNRENKSGNYSAIESTTVFIALGMEQGGEGDTNSGFVMVTLPSTHKKEERGMLVRYALADYESGGL